MNHIVKTTIKITASAVILLVLAVGAGVGYTWYTSQHAQENTLAFQEPTQATGGPQKVTHVKPASDAKVGASVQSITSPVVPGMNASIMVKTNADANCTITVVYDKTPSKDSGLTKKKADEYGLVEWTWTVESTVPLGNWPVKVVCANAKNSAMVQNDLRVVKSLE
jgi:hypothetical protein